MASRTLSLAGRTIFPLPSPPSLSCLPQPSLPQPNPPSCTRLTSSALRYCSPRTIPSSLTLPRRRRVM